MRVSGNFYLRSWLKNSLMAIGTGFALGYFSAAVIVIYIPPFNAILGAAVGFIVYQFSSYKRFFGSRRGEFEFEYRIDLIEKKIRALIFRHLGLWSYVTYFQDHFNAIRTTQKDACQRLLNNSNVIADKDNRYSICYKLANLELREDNFKNELAMLNLAVSLKPNDMLANFRLATCYEMDGLVEEAKRHYKTAAEDPGIVSNALREHILSQVNRIEEGALINKPPALGAKYQAW